jgi:L-asparaginase
VFFRVLEAMKVALVSTGGTIAMVGRHPYDWVDYGESGTVNEPETMLRELAPLLPDVPLEIVPVQRIGSTGITVADWSVLATLVAQLVARADISGVVVTHGTATLEETAWFLALTVTSRKPVVLVGAQRPPNTAGSDAGPNLRAAILVAHSATMRGTGVVVVMGGRIFDARAVNKLSNHDLNAFDAPDAGALGRVSADGRIVLRHHAVALPEERPWAQADLADLPRVDITYSYAGNDGAAVRAFLAAGAAGIVCAGLPPGRPANAERRALIEAVRAGVAVALSSRAVRGPVEPATDARRDGFLIASDLGPAKTRILLMLGLAVTRDPRVLQSLLDRF